jgi:hypothetical protein
MNLADVEAVDYTAYGALITAGTVFAAEPSRSASFRAFELARAAGLPIIFDIDYRPYSWPSPQVAEEVLSRAGSLADVIVGNDEEFGFMAGGIDKGLAKARDLAGSSASIVVYKMGPKGPSRLRTARRSAPGSIRSTRSSRPGRATVSWRGCWPRCRKAGTSARPYCADRPALPSSSHGPAAPRRCPTPSNSRPSSHPIPARRLSEPHIV